MAGPVDAADEVNVPPPRRQRRLPRPARLRGVVRRPRVAGGVALAVLAVVATGWLGQRVYDDHTEQQQRDEFVMAARQAAVNLTTIRYTEARADVARILDSATGGFRADFERRSQPFVEVVEQAKSTSEGTVTEAGLVSEHATGAQVLVSVSMKTSTAAAPVQEPRGWRLRIDLQREGDQTLVSNVEFVP